MKNLLASPTRRTVLVLIIAALSMCSIVVVKTRAGFGGNSRRFACKPGKWGNLECVRINIEMPEAFVSLDQIKSIHAHWFFKGESRDQAAARLKQLSLPAEQLDVLVGSSKWESDVHGCWLSPPDALVLSLGREPRQKLYAYLSDFPENESQYSPLVFRPTTLDERFKNSKLSNATIQKFKELLYQQGEMFVFADTDVLVNSLADDNEKIRLLKTVSRTPTLLVKLQMSPTSDVDELADYWGYGGRRKDVHALLESMTAVTEGCKIDIAHLLPSFPRQRIYTFPNPNADSITNQHCHWTSLNFLNDIPDPRFSNEAFARQTIQSQFEAVIGDRQLGDVLFFLDPEGMVIHSATYIADDIVFTKNGGAPNRPWIYMELQDLVACYTKPHEPLKIVAFRRKQS